MVSPVLDRDNQVNQVVAVVWDATSGRRLQRKIDAIDAAGRELARIESEAIKALAPGERLKLLQEKIIKYSKDLMHFDHFAIRLLNKRNNKLEVVIAEGLPPEALEIDLYAEPEGNGISGYVAATGRSYICHDTEKDPRYVLGLTHCKSSLTVALNLFGETVGVYNVESSTVGAFSEDDRQFDGSLDLVKAVLKRMKNGGEDSGLEFFLHSDAPPGSARTTGSSPRFSAATSPWLCTSSICSSSSASPRRTRSPRAWSRRCPSRSTIS